MHRRAVAEMREQQVGVLAGVPPLWGQVLDTRAFTEQPIASLRILTNAGGKLPVAAVRALRAAQPQARLFLMYGSTETIRGAFLPPEELDAAVERRRDELMPCGLRALQEVKRLPMNKPSGKYNVWNKITRSDGTSH